MNKRVELLDMLLNAQEALDSRVNDKQVSERDRIIQELLNKTSSITAPLMEFADVLHAQQTETQARLAQQQKAPALNAQAGDDQTMSASGLEELCSNLSPDFCFARLYPWQREFLLRKMGGAGLRGNALLCAGTASGKTHVAGVCALEQLVRQRKSVVFVVPYVALVDELTQRFRDLLPHGCGLCSLTGLKPLPQFLCTRPTLFLATIEKAQLLGRQLLEQSQIDMVGLWIIDELHTCAEQRSERAPRLELLVSFLLAVQSHQSNCVMRVKDSVLEQLSIGAFGKRFQILAMSATIDNKTDFAEWLNAEVFDAVFRPVAIKEFVLFQKSLYDLESCQVVKEVPALAENSVISAMLNARKPLISFCGTRQKVRQIAAQFSGIIKQRFPGECDAQKLLRREELLEKLQQKQQNVLNGVAAHSSEFLAADRQLIEEAFKDGLLHTIVATTTLAAGVNLPAKSIFIIGTKIGIQDIDPQYYRQMAGRAGRTKAAREGYCFLCVDTEEQLKNAKKLKQNHICKSQAMTEEFINNTFNSLLMMGYQLELPFHEILQKTLYAAQNPGSTPKEFKQNVSYLNVVQIVQIHQLTKQLSLTQLGRAAADSGLHAAQAHYYSLMISRIEEVGFDILTNDLVLLLISGLTLQQYQSFDPKSSQISQIASAQSQQPQLSETIVFTPSTFQEGLQQPQQGRVNYELIGNELNAFAFKFLYTSADQVAEHIGARQTESAELRYVLLQKAALLKHSIQRLQNGIKTTAEDEVVKTAVFLSGALSIFLETMGYENLKALVLAQQQKIRTLIEDDVTDLLQIRYVGINRARILKQAGFSNAQDIVAAGKEKLSLLLNFGEGTEMAIERIWAGAVELLAQ